MHIFLFFCLLSEKTNGFKLSKLGLRERNLQNFSHSFKFKYFIYSQDSDSVFLIQFSHLSSNIYLHCIKM